MIKIICLVRDHPAQRYFLNSINERHKISLAVIETPVNQPGWVDKLRSKGVWGSLEDITVRIMTLGQKRQRQQRDYQRYFGHQWQIIDPNIPLLLTEDINAAPVHERLKREKPDLILDHGTSLVKDHLLETAPLALNLHWGLSPYYRGSYCTEWALVNWDPYNIGVTIHKLAKKIDGGDILAQQRAPIAPQDSAHSINMQLTQLGAALLIKVIDRIEKGQELHFKKQDYAQGFMTCLQQWDRHILKQVENIESRGLLKTILARPARKEKLPIFEL